MKLKLAKTKKKDLPVIAEIYLTEFSKPPYNESWTKKKSTDKMKFFIKNYDLYTIKADNKIVGFIVVNPNFMCPGEVVFAEEMAIKEEFQSKGIGTGVWRQTFKIYKDKGFKKIIGIADVNSKAYGLYKKLGILPSKKNVLIEKRLR